MDNKQPANKPVIIIGAGWAGLATACFLAEKNIPVTLVESAKQLGGRARQTSSRTQVLDNGQHLMLGAYSELLDLLKLIGVNEGDVFKRKHQHLNLLNGQNLQPLINLKLPALPRPFNLLFGLLFCKGLSLKEKISVLYRFDRLLKKPISADQDCSVKQWLSDARLPPAYLTLLNALCLAAMNTPADKASALSFRHVLNETFNGKKGSTDLLIPSVNLAQVLPAPANLYLNTHHASVLESTKVISLQSDNNIISQVVSEQQDLNASAVVLATPAHISRSLLKPLIECNELCHHLDQFRYEPITTVYLRYNDSCQIPDEMIGLTETLSEWVFDRRVCDQPGMIAVVISSQGRHMELDNKELSLIIRNELAVIFPDWPLPNASWVIREKRATFSCTADVNRHRPGVITPYQNLFLSGDYLATDALYLPATLETAVRNAKACAQEVLNYLTQQTPL
ncbi:MAG: hydroxysqualene dehydroxylase HpnE [Gammaproteobacteria bacterium]|nr:hydroxysqualene dehydroxylase HpnE [Gammaproteobacteria bacterium]